MKTLKSKKEEFKSNPKKLTEFNLDMEEKIIHVSNALEPDKHGGNGSDPLDPHALFHSTARQITRLRLRLTPHIKKIMVFIMGMSLLFIYTHLDLSQIDLSGFKKLYCFFGLITEFMLFIRGDFDNMGPTAEYLCSDIDWPITSRTEP
tara:strand:- start:655 stop:1098 length:444 start_codon:yes stop_codon:yes gene_type:complete